MVKVQTAKQFNAEAYRKYQDAIYKSDYPKHTMPVLGQFAFMNEKTGEIKKSGYVASEGQRHVWAKTKKRALERLC